MTDLPAGYRHLALADTGSTNTVCLEKAREGEPGGLWVTAKRQLAGRGSRGRSWVSEPGNLYASLLLDDPGPLKSLAQITYVASLSLRDALIALLEAHAAEAGARGIARPLPDFSLKWPNDVLCNGRKIAGILLESHVIGERRIVICGMGTNVRHHPAGTLHPATSLLDCGFEARAQDLFPFLAQCFERRLHQWRRGSGFTSIRGDWLSFASGLGGRARVQLAGRGGNRVFEGIFEGMDGDGLMLLRHDDGVVEKIAAADIFFA